MFLCLLCILPLDTSGCNITLNVTENKQYFATEGYPDAYMNDQDCHFNFEAPPGRRIVIFFEDFHLRDGRDFLHFRKFYTIHRQIHKQT